MSRAVAGPGQGCGRSGRLSSNYNDFMPTYVYAVIKSDGSDGDAFEVVQRMSDPPLEKHPQSGEPVRRVPQAPHIAGDWSESGTKKVLSDKNLDRLGFTKYQNAGGGVFEKRAGKGPDAISSD